MRSLAHLSAHTVEDGLPPGWDRVNFEWVSCLPPVLGSMF